MTGEGRVPLEEIDIEEARDEMFIDRLEGAGWACGGGWTDETVNLGFFRDDRSYMLGVDETAVRLGLIDDQGATLKGFRAFDKRTNQEETFGYEVLLDEDINTTMLGYSGPRDNEYEAFFERLLALGHDLIGQQADDDLHLTLPGKQPEAGRVAEPLWPLQATNKLMRQITDSENEGGTLRGLIESGMTRHEAIAGIASVAAGSFLADIPKRTHQLQALSIWHSHVGHRNHMAQSALVKKFRNDPDVNARVLSHPVIETLSGIEEGIMRASKTIRETYGLPATEVQATE